MVAALNVIQHRHESCRDGDCERPYCRIWREAKEEFYKAGYDDGYKDGLAARPLEVEVVVVTSGSSS